MGHDKFINSNVELWFLPCYSNAFGQKNLSSPENRVAMLKSVVNYMGERVSICTDEIEMANKAGIYAVVKELIRKYPEREFYYVIGSDQAAHIREWRNSRDLLKIIPFIVVKRFGSVNKVMYDWCFSDSHIWIEKPINLFVLDKSGSENSSDIRNSYHNNWKYQSKNKHKGLLVNTHEHITDYNLYK
jgi:nicotinic acid mononucleotide adenylyltransferase